MCVLYVYRFVYILGTHYHYPALIYIVEAGHWSELIIKHTKSCLFEKKGLDLWGNVIYNLYSKSHCLRKVPRMYRNLTFVCDLVSAWTTGHSEASTKSALSNTVLVFHSPGCGECCVWRQGEDPRPFGPHQSILVPAGHISHSWAWFSPRCRESTLCLWKRNGS